MDAQEFLKKHKLDDSLGTIDKDGKLKFPKQSISGQTFDKSQTRVRIGKANFVVLDRFLSESVRNELIEGYTKYLKVDAKPAKKADSNEST